MGEDDETVGGSVAASDVRFHVIVSGRVQGVFFRDACRQTARDLGVRGWVRNRSDGAVELVEEVLPGSHRTDRTQPAGTVAQGRLSLDPPIGRAE